MRPSLLPHLQGIHLSLIDNNFLLRNLGGSGILGWPELYILAQELRAILPPRALAHLVDSSEAPGTNISDVPGGRNMERQVLSSEGMDLLPDLNHLHDLDLPVAEVCIQFVSFILDGCHQFQPACGRQGARSLCPRDGEAS